MSSKSLQDPFLIKIKDGIETKLPEELKEPTNRIVIAGMKLLYSPQTHATVIKLYEQIKQGNFNPEAIANGMVNLLGLIMKASGGKMPVQGAFPAGAILLCYVLEDFERLYQFKPTLQILQDILKAMTPKFAKAFGLGKQQAPPTAGAAPTAPPSLAGGVPPQPAAQGAM